MGHRKEYTETWEQDAQGTYPSDLLPPARPHLLEFQQAPPAQIKQNISLWGQVTLKP